MLSGVFEKERRGEEYKAAWSPRRGGFRSQGKGSKDRKHLSASAATAPTVPKVIALNASSWFTPLYEVQEPLMPGSSHSFVFPH